MTSWAMAWGLERPSGMEGCPIVHGGPVGMRVGSPVLPGAFGLLPEENHWGQVTLLLC